MKVKTFKIVDSNSIEQQINNWLLLSKDKEVKHITQSYIPPVIIPIREHDPIREDPQFKNASFTERRGYHLFSIFYIEKK